MPYAFILVNMINNLSLATQRETNKTFEPL